MMFVKSFVISIIFIAIFVFTNALFINWSLPTNFCVAVGLSWFTITLWKWTSNIIAFKKSGMKLPEEPEKKDVVVLDPVVDPAFSDCTWNIWYNDWNDDSL